MKKSVVLLIFIVLILIFTSCTDTGNIQEVQYKFPLDRSDIENVLEEQGIDWSIEYEDNVSDSHTIYTLGNNQDINIFAISSQAEEYGNFLNMTFVLPGDLTDDEINGLYSDQLYKLLNLTGTFYGNSKKINNNINDFLNDYLAKDYEEGIYWTRRIGEDHLIIEINPWKSSPDGKKIGTLKITSNDIFERYLKSLAEGWRNMAEAGNIDVTAGTVADILNQSDSIVNEEPPFGLYVTTAKLDKIKKLKTIPESLEKINSSLIKQNKENYLKAKLVDKTGEVDVFIQPTSLNNQELGEEREHSLILFNYEDKPVIIVCYSAKK